MKTGRGTNPQTTRFSLGLFTGTRNLRAVSTFPTARLSFPARRVFRVVYPPPLELASGNRSVLSSLTNQAREGGRELRLGWGGGDGGVEGGGGTDWGAGGHQWRITRVPLSKCEIFAHRCRSHRLSLQ